jgi:hypothetical protein
MDLIYACFPPYTYMTLSNVLAALGDDGVFLERSVVARTVHRLVEHGRLRKKYLNHFPVYVRSEDSGWHPLCRFHNVQGQCPVRLNILPLYHPTKADTRQWKLRNRKRTRRLRHTFRMRTLLSLIDKEEPEEQGNTDVADPPQTHTVTLADYTVGLIG